MVAVIDAVLLAGGRGTRAEPYLGTTPKVLAPISERPLLDVHLERLARSGVVGRVILALGHGADQVAAHLEKIKPLLPVKYLVEKQPAGTATAVRRCLPQLSSDPFYVQNGDTLVDLNLAEMLGHLHARRAPYLVARDRTTGANAGAYLIGRMVRVHLDLASQEDFDKFLASLRAPNTAYAVPGFIDVGTEEGYRRANDHHEDPVPS